MWVGIQQDQQSDLFSLRSKPLRHFQRYQAAEGVADQDTRVLRIEFFEPVQIKLGHFLHALQRLCRSVHTLRLDAIDGITRSNVFCKFAELCRTAQTMRNKNWRLLATIFDLNKGRRPGKSRHKSGIEINWNRSRLDTALWSRASL